MKLEGKTAIVTGAARGIGRGISIRLAQEGVDVSMADLDEKGVAEAAKEIRLLGRGALNLRVDVTRSDEVKEMARKTLEEFGKIDILVNNAATNAPGYLVDYKEEDWDLLMNVNAKSVFLCSKYVAPHMISRRDGRIINMASQAGLIGGPGGSAYCASKGAVILFTRSIAKELAPYNITVNAICPGAVYTPIWETVARGTGRTGKEALETYVKENVPLGRPQTIEDIAETVVFLVLSDNITGQAISVDGGWVMH